MSKAKSHPENFCHQCGSKNPTWYAPNEIWNQVCEPWEIICPSCFQDRCDESGLNIVFKTEPSEELDEQQLEDKRIEELTERNVNIVGDFMEHCQENGLTIPDNYFESYFNA